MSNAAPSTPDLEQYTSAEAQPLLRRVPPTDPSSVATDDGTDNAPCPECGGSLPAGRRRFCGDECSKANDRRRAKERYRSRSAGSRKGARKKAAPAVKRTATEPAATTVAPGPGDGSTGDDGTAPSALTTVLVALPDLLAADRLAGLELTVEGVTLAVRTTAGG